MSDRYRAQNSGTASFHFDPDYNYRSAAYRAGQLAGTLVVVFAVFAVFGLITVLVWQLAFGKSRKK